MKTPLYQRFGMCCRGSIPMMTALLLLPIIVISGGAIDLVAYERMRTGMQDGLDRGVLAAASLSQRAATRELLESYVRPTVPPDAFDLNFIETKATNARTVNASLRAEIDTAFLHLIGIETMSAEVHSTAEEKRSNIEISLILDVSGSMRFDSSGRYPGLNRPMRIDHLRPAAKGFLDVVLSDRASDYTTVNLVPYAGQVSVGPVIYDLLMQGPRAHRKSSCFEFNAGDFKLGVPDFPSRGQTPHFTNANHHDKLSNNEQKSTEPWWCPDDPHSPVAKGQIDWVENETNDTDVTSISVMSNDRLQLQKRIDGYKLYDGTGTPIAMKWGLLMLDPAIQPLMAQAARSYQISQALGLDPKFADRPAAFDDNDTLKFIVLMTDGAVSSQVRPNAQLGPIQYYNNTSANAVLFSESQAEQHTKKLCDDAKAKGVTIYTIGFDVDSKAASQMQNCASNPAFFYRVNSLNIEDAFKSIATAIQQIKLIG